MENEITTLFAISRFSSGRRVSLYNQLEDAARARGLVAVLPYIAQAREHDLATREIDDRWAAPDRRTRYPRSLRRVDNLTDGVMGQFRNIARAHIADLDPEDPFRQQVEHMLTTLFPAGLAAITSLPYIDQVAAVENILAWLEGDFAPLVADLALQRKVTRLAQLTEEYRRAVDRTTGPLSFATVRKARDRGHAYMLEIICMIVGIFHDSDNPEHAAARAELLSPIIEHSRTASALRRRGRTRDEVEDENDIDELDDETEGDAGEGDEGEGDEGEGDEGEGDEGEGDEGEGDEGEGDEGDEASRDDAIATPLS